MRTFLRCCAWAVVLALIVAPIAMVTEIRYASPLWALWSLVSLWAALDALRIAATALPTHSLQAVTGVVVVLALLNLATSLIIVVVPLALRTY